MKAAFFLAFSFWLALPLSAQDSPINPVVIFNIEKKKQRTYTLNFNQIRTGFNLIHSATKLENQLIRAKLTFKPSEKTFRLLDTIGFKSLEMDFFLQPVGQQDRDRIYHGQLEIQREDLVGKRTWYSVRELFSFSDYDWEWEKVPLGTQEKKVRFGLMGIHLNGKKIEEELPDLFSKLEIELEIIDDPSRYEDLKEVLLHKGIYPNKSAFDIFYESNAQMLFQENNRFSKKKLQDYHFPLADARNLKEVFKVYTFETKEVQKLKNDLDAIIKSVKLNRITPQAPQSLRQYLKELSKLLGKIGSLAFNNNEGRLILAELRFLIHKILTAHESKLRLNDADYENLLAAAEDVLFLIQFQRNAKSTGAHWKNQNSNARLVSQEQALYLPPNNDVSVRVIAQTADGKPFQAHLTDGFYIRCVPWALRNETTAFLKKQQVYYEFPDPSTPTEYPHLPAASYSFWVEDGAGNRIPLSQERNNQYYETVKIRPTNSKISNWLRRLIWEDEPMYLNLGLVK